MWGDGPRKYQGEGEEVDWGEREAKTMCSSEEIAARPSPPKALKSWGVPQFSHNEVRKLGTHSPARSPLAGKNSQNLHLPSRGDRHPGPGAGQGPGEQPGAAERES